MAKRVDNQDEEKKSGDVPQKSGSYPQYVHSAAMLSTAYPLGAPRLDKDIATFQASADDPLYARSVDERSSVPGIMVINYLPTLGVSTTRNSALNRAMDYEFTAIRSKISGRRPYEPPDHMIYRICVDSLRELYNYICRAYQIVNNYTATNLYMPMHMMKALGLDYDAWKADASNVLQWLESHANALASYPTVPIGQITDRRNVMNSVIFTDGELPCSQMYVFNQRGFYSYKVVDEAKGVSVVIPEGGTPSDYFNMWDDMFAALASSTDVAIITSDIRLAFGDQVITALTPPTRSSPVTVQKFDVGLTNIMNLQTAGVIDLGRFGQEPEAEARECLASLAEALRIKDAGGNALRTTGHYQRLIPWENGSRYGIGVPGYFSHINAIKESPSTEDIVESVRLKPLVDCKCVIHDYDDPVGKTAVVTVHFDAIITEAVAYVECFTIAVNGELDTKGINSSVTFLDSEVAFVALEPIAAASCFDFMFPRVYDIVLDGVDATMLSVTLEDVQNYVPLSRDVSKQLSDAILLAEFNIPG